MILFLIRLVFMSLQAVLIIGAVFGMRRLSAALHISKKYVMLLWMIPFFFLVFPWKITVVGGFWSRAVFEIFTFQKEAGPDEGGTALTQQDPARAAAENGSKQDSNSGELKNRQEISDAQKSASALPPDAQDIRSRPETGNAKTDQKLAEQQMDLRKLSASLQDAFLTAGKMKKYSVLFHSACAVWAAGLLFFLMRGVLACRRLKKSVLCSACQSSMRGPVSGGGDIIFYADGIQVPFVLGFFKPRIYLPSDMEETYAGYVTAHEYVHIKRKDHITKAAAYVITCIHWFNPAVWCAYDFMAKDMEMACDEETVARIGIEKRKEYASALLKLSAGKENIFAAPPAFGKGDMKKRIQNIMHYQKTMKKAAVFAAAAGIFLTGLFLTAEKKEIEDAAAAGRTEAGKTAAQQPAGTSAGTAGSEAASDGADAAAQQAAHEGQLTFAMVREAFAAEKADELAFQKYTNGKYEKPAADALNAFIYFMFAYEDETYRLDVSYGVKTDQLEDIYITRLSDAQMAWLYTKDQGKEKYPADLEIYLHTKISIDDWLTLELPAGYTLGSYQADLGGEGGALIYPEIYPTQDDTAPQHWKYAGFVGKIGYARDIFVFEDKKLQDDSFPKENHSTMEPVGIMDTITAGLGWHTLMAHGQHELYTAAGLAELEEKGTDLRSIKTESAYWYFYFVKEGEETAYFLSLSAERFTKEEAIAAARTVKITEDEQAVLEKKAVRNALDAYFSDLISSLRADSSRVFKKEEFAGVNGYLAAKWIMSTRESYKDGLGGIRTAQLTGTELLDLKKEDGRLEALVNVTYEYAWGSGTEEDTCKAGCLFEAVLKPSGSAYQVMDIDCVGSREIMAVKEQMEREGLNTAQSYAWLDRYFEQLQNGGGN